MSHAKAKSPGCVGLGALIDIVDYKPDQEWYYARGYRVEADAFANENSLCTVLYDGEIELREAANGGLMFLEDGSVLTATFGDKLSVLAHNIAAPID